MRTLPAMYVYGIYRHAHSARHVRIYGFYRHATSYWNDSIRFRIIVYMHVTMATGSMTRLCLSGPASAGIHCKKVKFTTLHMLILEDFDSWTPSRIGRLDRWCHLAVQELKYLTLYALSRETNLLQNLKQACLVVEITHVVVVPAIVTVLQISHMQSIVSSDPSVGSKR